MHFDTVWQGETGQETKEIRGIVRAYEALLWSLKDESSSAHLLVFRINSIGKCN
jgi:hypothetical protein